MLTTGEAAARLGRSERTIRRAIARGEIPAIREGGSYRIAASVIDQFAAPPSPPKLVRFPHAPDVMTPLPAQLTRFVGRQHERATVVSLLRNPDVRLLTLTGPGGIGKTRLAMAAAGEVATDFPDGVVFVDLAAIAHADLVLPAIADALGVKEPVRHDLHQRVRAFLAPRRILLVADNFEHVIPAATELSPLLANASGLTVLVTSRIPLRLAGERELAVPPLSMPGGERDFSLQALLGSDAGRLFVERAEAIDAAFEMDDPSAAAIAEICHRLDGLPLAIELAAARVKSLPPRQLRDRLERRLPLLTGAPRDATPRHATMRDAIAWSYDLASVAERRLFRILSVFSGGFTLEAVEAVASAATLATDCASAEAGGDDGPTSSPLDLIAALVDQSLLIREHGLDGEPRYRLLETIREYGLERLSSAEETAARTAHARYFLRLARAQRPLANTRSTRAPLARLEADGANLRAALDWLERNGPVADLAGLVASCYTYLFALSHFREAEQWLEIASGVLDGAAAADRARLVIGFGELLMIQGQLAAANVTLAEGLELVRAQKEPFDLAMAMISRGASLNYGGAYGEAAPILQEALATAEAITDPTLRAVAAGRALANLGVSARGLGDLDLAESLTERALIRFQGRHLELAEIRTLMDLADIARDQGKSRLAIDRYRSCLMTSGERGELRLLAEALAGIAAVACDWRQQRAALLLFGAADAARERIGIDMRLPVDIAMHERRLEALRATMGDARVRSLLVEGQSLTLDEALRVAESVAAPGDDDAVPADPMAELTGRERDVLRLLTSHRTDREIAEALYISRRTVNWHVHSILGKLGVETRREAAALALARGLG
ncbi:MAG: LuxR C-terminal-related transcriptional regulator [Thermomicrobiales bacterium]